ncbi:MAG: hypothetical protein N0E59_16805 [Candidatus Thiodiazotropha taylori]|uniref:Uncharacterized protein n=1 Tax=Candidatus Thiodiazotropha taylori TaxID=2792791 RepID=A0A9E4N486_9GAMM|nr:hypothetical protein [Candidatus Thiodiazotropha taylori]MCG8028046.1 hypothetical protein [Candidatus Thiodiazotropha taylori]MCG8108588.1 hypothetical protein [Candidatus Thiodiazotropha taylori]MCG8112416.1 hypothetical protein [Candidatus Thiodiazotropha taylori]MCW4256734.1 hypothetical protein [Candidatus Thiodiazotropha taylori]
MKHTSKLFFASVLCTQAFLFNGCGGSSSNNSSNDDANLGLPAEMQLIMLNALTGAYYSFDSTTETRTDINEMAAASQDSAVQNLQITDVSTIGHFFHWPDFRLSGTEELLDLKYLLMVPGYTPGDTIDADQFVQLTHLHDEELAAHSAEEFRDPEAGSAIAAGLERLNTFVTKQSELEEEIAEVIPAGEQLCRAYIDPYLEFELEQEEAGAEEGTGGEEHAHGALVHFALTQSGRVYFYEEHEGALEELQGFVTLDDVVTISDCNRTTIGRVSEDGVLIFIPDTQMLYLVDAHGGDFHQHSTWSASLLMPEGVNADMMAIIGSGGEHDHDHE